MLDVGNFVFNTKAPEDSIEYKGELYLLQDGKQGLKFTSSSQRNFEIKKWRYQSKDGDSLIQVIASENTIQYSLLEKISENDIETQLDLDSCK